MADVAPDTDVIDPSMVPLLPVDQSAQESESEDHEDATASQHPKTPGPLQKRRRVTRACDECRRKKIKCDGRQPCTHCTVYSYDCTYDQPSNRRRNPAPQYIEGLENRLQKAETLLRTLLPNVDLNDPNSLATAQKVQDSNEKARSLPGDPRTKLEASEQDAQLHSMIESTGELGLDDQGYWDFHGGSSGRVFVHRMRDQFGGLLGGPDGKVLPRLPPAPLIPYHVDSPKSSTESSLETGLPNTLDLPSRDTAGSLCDAALSISCAILRFVHKPTFDEMLERIYQTPVESFGDAENRFLPLLYMALAIGCLFHLDPSEHPDSVPDHAYKVKIDQGLKYYKAAQTMVDITDCRDLTSLQAVIFMTMFLQSSANLNTCYSYIGIAQRSAVRMGLHRNLAGSFDPIEQETRRRVFWVIRILDTYVSTLLGFPHMLSSDDIDQEFPTADDEYITKERILPMSPGKMPLMAASNAHASLMAILAKVIKYIYPIKGLETSAQGVPKATYNVTYTKIREIEKDLAAWLDNLPMALRPGGDGSPDILRVQQLLRLAYAHVQMMLYRPFLHYVSEKTCAGKAVDDRSYACAAACVSVSRNIVHITVEMKKRGLLIGAFWFTMYTTFFAILSLVFFVLENPDKNGSKQILVDAHEGKDALKGLAKMSLAADRCSVALVGLFDKLPERLKKNRPDSAGSRKRRSATAASSKVSDLAIVRGSPSVVKLEGPQVGVAKAKTFPTRTSTQTPGPLNTEFPSVATTSNPDLRQNFQAIVSPSFMSSTSTPDSSSAIQNMGHSPYDGPQTSDTNSVLPQVGAMMFPSTDPFAYPSRPAMTFQSLDMTSANTTSEPPSFLRTDDLPIYNDVQGQLFGPLPPWIRGPQTMEVQYPGNFDHSMMSGISGQDVNYHTGFTPNAETNLDGIFQGDDAGWNTTDPRYNQ